MIKQNKKPDHDQELEEKYEGLLPDAIIFAFNAHSGEYRKINSKQYIIHPLRVSEFLLKNFNHREELEMLRCIAVLHDTIEDTWVTDDKIREVFGEEIAKVVVELTVPEEKNKEESYKKYLDILNHASDEAKIIKLADIFDNVISTNENKKWKKFLTESKEMLNFLELKKPDKKFNKIKKELSKSIEQKLVNYEN